MNENNLTSYLQQVKKNLSDSKKIVQPYDSINQTYGCRHFNSHYCKNNSMVNICAFIREDNIYKIPPVSWKMQFCCNEKPEQTNSGVKYDRIEEIELRTLCRK